MCWGFVWAKDVVLSKQIFFVLPLGRYLCQISLDWLALLAYTSLPLHPKPKDCELSHFF